MLAAVPAPAPEIVTQLREAILVELATSGADLARVAKRVAMSTRTVQRDWLRAQAWLRRALESDPGE